METPSAQAESPLLTLTPCMTREGAPGNTRYVEVYVSRSSGGYSAITVALFDADRDGRMDLLTGTMDIQSRSQGERLRLFLNTVE